MRRWRVYKDHEDRWLRWIAVPARELWWEKPQGLRFPEWGMAMHYADRMARTAQPETIGHPSNLTRQMKTLEELGFKRRTSV